jgi:integrase
MTSIFRRTGRGGYTLKYRDASGRLRFRSFRTRGAAEDEALRLRRHPDSGHRQTLNTYAEEWLKHKARHLRTGTLRQYKLAMNHHILPELGLLSLADLSRMKVRRFLDGLKVKRKTAANIAGVLSGCLRQAVRDELIYSNPAADRLFVQSKGERASKIKAFTAEQLRAFLEACRVELPERYLLFRFMALTGVRLGEALALQWEDLDFGGSKALVRRGWTEGRIEPTKTGRERTIDVPREITNALKAEERLARKLALSSGQPRVPWVFPSAAGSPIWSQNVRRDFAGVVRKAELPRHHTPHSLRHTYASLQLSAGESIYYVQRQLGHATITMTTDLYGRWLPAGNPEAAERLARALSPVLSPASGNQAPQKHKRNA